MTEEVSPAPEEVSPIETLRSEFQEQFDTLKKSFETEREANEKTISELRKENEDLHRALIRSAQIPVQAPAPVKTEEEIYNERIAELSAKTVKIMKGEIL